MNIEEFEYFLSKKAKLKYSQEEFTSIWEYFNPDITETVNVVNVVKGLRFNEFLFVAKNTKVFLEDFLFVSCKFLIEEYLSFVEKCEEWGSFYNLDELLMSFAILNIEINEEVAPFVFTQIVLKKRVTDVIDEFNLIPAELNKLFFVAMQKKSLKMIKAK